jgi:hypothetical protein
MPKFTMARGADTKLAALIVGPALTELAQAAADGAKAAAPPNKVWVTVADEQVRRTHREAHDQAVPENLRFSLHTPEHGQDTAGTQWELGIAPRDEAGFSKGNTINCRCEAFLGGYEGSLASHITAKQARAARLQVRATVDCDHPLCVNAEFGNSVDPGARYLAAGLRAARARLH